ncbi:hypothetical protein HYH02_015287 [Chlamydomonas schloesseri]|uniref:Peptidase M11 gametolysin domain-containing protein n=1 Tax=Chlamydomonas schloesseri TaxID=2026947 RepID=A0A835VNT1_9CHLO|nr:hypothetical protein HYH02_015287 [Chlamydomonas schloesseri]|eukprot:KAG2423672.1 hypothetical protein HYH02_015287 [Chlamydomonas schloesseri]
MRQGISIGSHEDRLDKPAVVPRRALADESAPPPLDVPYCRFFGLRHILAASDRDNGGLRRCGVCTFDAEWCTVLCAYCLDSSDSPSPSEVSLELTHCRPTEGEIVVDGEGYLMCRMAPNPPDTPMPPPEPPVYPPPPPPATPVTLTGTVEVYTSHLYNSPNRTAPDMSYAVTFSNESTGYSLKATFNLGALADTADVQTGDRLSFKVTAAPPGSRRRLMSNCDEITGLCFDPAAAEGNSTTSGKDFVVDGKAVNITSIVMLATVCGALPRISLDKLRSTLFNADQASAVNTRNVTLQHYYATCSYGKIQFRPENNLVTTVNLPCTALYQTSASGVQTWYKSQTSCDAPELYGWMRDGLTQAATNLGLASTTPYKRKVLFLPNRQACDWPGMASVGCDTSCNTWINQMSPTNVDVQVLFQELGHNIGLQHANRWIDGVNQEYEDFTDPMGTGWVENDDFQNKTMICLGAAEAYKAGWALPAASFNLTEDLVPGSPVTVTIPSMHVTDTNFLYINVTSLPPFKPSWPGNAQPLNRTHQLFISYRVRQPAPGFDSGLTPEMSKKVYVHNYNATLRSPPRPDPGDVAMKSSLIAVLGTQRGSVKGMDVNTAFRFDFGPLVGGRTPVNGLHIAPLSLGPDSATLSVCYFAVARESDVEGGCGNGIDDDCDGYVDGDDTDCGGVRSPPPTKSPPPPPPTKSPPPPPPVKPPPPPPVKPLPPPPVKSPPPPPVKPPPPPPVKSPPPVKPPPQLPPPAKSPPPPPPSASSPPSPPPPLAASTKSPPPPAKNPPSPPKKRPPPPTGSSGHRHHHHRSRRSQLLESHDLRQ